MFRSRGPSFYGSPHRHSFCVLGHLLVIFGTLKGFKVLNTGIDLFVNGAGVTRIVNVKDGKAPASCLPQAASASGIAVRLCSTVWQCLLVTADTAMLLCRCGQVGGQPLFTQQLVSVIRLQRIF
jgi:hypothetical protein